MEGCARGNCLRSHVNQTEVMLALAMSESFYPFLQSSSSWRANLNCQTCFEIPPFLLEVGQKIDSIADSRLTVTKAGVPTNKVMVGESSYGRSFHMAHAGCIGPDCFFTGNSSESDAAKGRCTGTSGYLANAEIEEIIANPNGTVKTWHDEGSASDYLVYDGTF